MERFNIYIFNIWRKHLIFTQNDPKMQNSKPD